MRADDAQRLAGVQRVITAGVQRHARQADRLEGERLEAAMREFRSYIYGIKDGLSAMGMTAEAINEVVRKAGWDSRISSYHLYRQPSILDKRASA